MPGHSADEMAAKLSAISTLASAHGKKIFEIATGICEWLKKERTSMEAFLESGTPKEAAELMRAVADSSGRRSYSLVSKYLAYHSNGRWMIYDSFVRTYVHAMWGGDVYRRRAAVRVEEGEATYVPRTIGELASYDNYCNAVESLWSVLALPAPNSARMREAVFWYRSKNCARVVQGALL
jgi:hypothetical protein